VRLVLVDETQRALGGRKGTQGHNDHNNVAGEPYIGQVHGTEEDGLVVF